MDALTDMTIMLGVSSPYVVVFVMLTIGIWIFPFAEELALIAAGYYIYQGEVDWWWMVPVATAGVFLGDTVLFWLGRDRGPLSLLLRQVVVRRYHHWMEQIVCMFEQYGAWALFCARFLPGLRFLVHVLAGVSRMSIPRYCKVSLLAVLVYVPVVVTFASRFGSDIDSALQQFHQLEYAGWMLILTMSAYVALQYWGAFSAGSQQSQRK